MFYKFQQQIDQRGYYAEIALNSNYEENLPTELVINFNAPLEWEISCKAGIQFFFDIFSKKKRGRLEINIEDIKWRPVDTTNLVITYTVMTALCENLNFEMINFDFDTNKKALLLPLK